MYPMFVRVLRGGGVRTCTHAHTHTYVHHMYDLFPRMSYGSPTGLQASPFKAA